MNTNQFSKTVVLIAFSITFLIPQNPVRAQDLNFVEIPLEDFHDEKPIELHGLNSSQSLSITIPQSWSLGRQNWIQIQFRASPLLDAAQSSITISLNGSQLASQPLTQLLDSEQRIPIPAELFRVGNNTLTFTSSLYLPNDQETNCQNWDDPSRWLAIDPGALLHLSVATREHMPDLASFSQVFTQPLERYLPNQLKRQLLIVLPENPTQDDLTSLATLSSALGSYADANYEWDPEIMTSAQFDAKSSRNRDIVFIGHTPTQLQNTTDETRDYVTLHSSPWSTGNTVMIIGDHDRQDGFSPASVLSDPARKMLLQGSIAYVEQQPLPARSRFPNRLSFEDLGYLDRTVTGIGQQSLIYSVYIPYDIEPFLVKLNLELVHTPDLDIRNSSFVVHLNGLGIAGIQPAAQNTIGQPITVGLPAKKFRRGINFIRISFNLQVPQPSCERPPESVSATILNRSSLEISYRNRTPIPSLKYFPLPFSDYAGTTFVLPDDYSQRDLDHLARLAFMIGNATYEFSRPPLVITASHFASQEKEHPNVILIGLPSENSITRGTNDLLPQPFTENGNFLQEGYGVYFPAPNKNASLGLMEVIRSPWSKDGTMLVLTGTDQQGQDWAWDVILNPALRDRFAGNLMVVGSVNRNAAAGSLSNPGSPQAIFQQVADASNIPIIGSFLQRSGQAFLMPSLIGIGMAFFLVIGVMSGVNWAENKKTPDTTRKMEEDEYHDQ